jgi:dynein heavy chain
MAMRCDKHMARIEELSENADQEYKLEVLLSKMKDEWARTAFTLTDFHQTRLLKDTDPLRLVADDHLAKTQSMLASPYAAAIAHEVRPWFEKLQRMSLTLDAWLQCQFGYRYLWPIFTAGDIANSLPEETRLFAGVDEHWQQTMEGTSKAPNVLTKTTDERLLPLFTECNAKLERIMRQLVTFLDNKRVAFPRFYFLSNDDLISVLSETKDPTLVQPHMKKCFEGIAELTFVTEIPPDVPPLKNLAAPAPAPVAPNDDPFADAKMVTAMNSAEGERVALVAPVRPALYNNAAEKWLNALEQAMIAAVKANVAAAYADFPIDASAQLLPTILQSPLLSSPQETMIMTNDDTGRDSPPPGPPIPKFAPDLSTWLSNWPGMAILTAMQLWWTATVEDAIAHNGLDDAAKATRNFLQQMVVMVRGRLDKVTMATLQALIVLQVHSCDIVDSLAASDRVSLTSFDWTSQLRYYANRATGGVVRVHQIFANIAFGYEYLGNSSRLVITPLTDRCYRTLTSAFHANYGGAPEGPAGTGKTETTKDLAKALGKQCVVYNCSDQIRPADMEKLLRGLAACGAWGCFDEFNRVELQVLSIIAQQVLSIQTAVTQKRIEFLFEGSLCALKEGCSMFVTMNPGYAGRSELPDNLKALFRPVAMMVPDYALIAENSLFSCGFMEAPVLSRKIVATYKLCSEQLSSQGHYDYGMRAVKAVLLASQQLKQEMPNEPEMAVVRRAIFDVNRPKFLAADAVLFDGILKDLFGNVQAKPQDYDALHRGLKAACGSWAVSFTPAFITKAQQIFETVRVRHGIMIVGQAGSGKTTCLKAVAAANCWATESGAAGASVLSLAPTHIHTLNPKSVTMPQLYGFSDASGTDWHDGLLSQRFRHAATDGTETRHWIVLDGPVDANWIENMNTVLDDNKKLCLTNGDIIRMTNRMTMVFEAKDLAAASPATVSRCGMIFFEPSQLGWEPLVTSWLSKFEEIEIAKQITETGGSWW